MASRLRRPSRSLILLAVITLLAILACGVGLNARYAAEPEARQLGGLLFEDLQGRIDEVARIELAHNGESFTLTRSDEGWSNDALDSFPAEPAAIEAMLTALAGMRYAAPRTRRPALFAKLGLEGAAPGAATTELSLIDAAGTKLADLLVGKAKSDSRVPGVYIRLPGQNQAWLATGLLELDRPAANWSDRLVTDIEGDALLVLTLEHADGETLDLLRADPGDEKLTLGTLPADHRIEHQFQIDYLSGLLKGLTFDVARAATGETTSRVTALSRDGVEITLQAGEAETDGTVWAKISARLANDVEPSAAARAEVDRINTNFAGWQVKLPRKVTDRLKIRLSDIVNSETGSQESDR